MCCDVCVCCLYSVIECVWCFFFSSRRRHTSCALVTGVQTCALPISITGVILSKYVILSALHQVGDKERIQMDRSALEQIQQAELSAVMQAYVGLDRKSVVEGQSVSVRVDLGGSRIIKKKIKYKIAEAIHMNRIRKSKNALRKK